MSPSVAILSSLRGFVCIALATGFCLLTFITHAGTFPGNADLTVSDSTGALSWNTTNHVLTVQCWFEISVPSGANVTQNMTILANGTSGSEPYFAYLVRYNISNGNVEFVAQGNSGGYTNTLIQQPYLERWYHVAVVEQQSGFLCYVDGQEVPTSPGSVGNSGNMSGLSIGGWGGGQYLYGEVQEVSIYQSALSPSFISQYMFQSQPTNYPTLKGYFPLAYSTNSATDLANFAQNQAPGTANAVPPGGGTVTFTAVNEAGEQSAFDANRDGGRDVIAPLSGAFSWQQTAFSRPTPGVAFDFEFGYSSANSSGGSSLSYEGTPYNPYSGGLMGGSGWRTTFDTQIIPSQYFLPAGASATTSVGLMYWNGAIETWDENQTNQFQGYGPFHTRSEEYKGELVITPTNCQWTTPDRLVYSFVPPQSASQMAGRLTSISDFNGNSVQLSYNSFGVLTQVVDSAGGTYAFNSNPNTMLLTNVTFNSWQINFGYDATNRLVSKTITNTSGIYTGVNTTWQFQYGANGLLSQIIDPRGNTGTSVQYDQYGRMTNEMDALGRATTTFYDTPNFLQLTRIDPGTNTWLETYDRKGNMLAQADPLGNTTSYTYDTNANRISIARPLGWTTAFGYDNRANVIASTNALGLVSQWTMDAFFNKAVQAVNPTGWTNAYSLNETNGNLLMHSDAIGALVNYTYATNGLVLSSTEANGHATSFSYDTNGFLISKTDSATNVTRYTHNDVGWKLSETNALNQVTTYAYDLNGNVVQTVDPLSRTFTKTYDANGNLLSASDAKGQLTTFGYDAANQKIAMTNRAGFAWIYAYNSRGSLQSTTDPIGYTVSWTYDAANRLVAVTAPLGNTVSNIYDADGNVTTTIDQLGQSWSKTYDRLDRIVASSDPQGDITTTTFDADGRVSEITSPNGYPTTHSYDGRGRLIKWVDTQNFPWLYSYDGVGNITNITDALGGHYIMAYGLRNERLFEQNQDSNIWHYAYDPLLRLQQKTEPNGITRTYSYDAGSRVTEVDYSTTRVDAFTYDLNDNPIIMSRSGSGPATQNSLSYDSMDRVVGDTDTFGNTVGYSYDAVGRRQTLTYPGGKILTYNYDALNRLTNQVDWAGRQMNYAYDKAGRLLTRTYPNNIVQSNAFDNAGRIIGLNYTRTPVPNPLPITVSIALTYAYDLNGNKTGSTEQGTLAWPMPSLHNESSTYTPAGKLITRNDALSATNNFTYQYDSSGNMTNAVSAGESYALTYDEDNRTMSIEWTLGALMDETISNRYDVFGRRVSKTAAGIETRYALDLGGGMERVLCDMNSSVITEWYVYGPDLCYKVDATNGLTCYHADAMGNIIALTGGNTNLIAEYAYTPYGRTLSSTNSQSQISNPYLFVGSQGVMEDLPDLYFTRARYYSADASAFLSTDPVKHIGPGWMPSGYLYAGGNPISRMDPSGQWFGIDDALFAGGGALVGLGAQFVSDLASGDLTSGHWSSWQTYVGAAAGGGETALYAIPTTGPLGVAAAGAAAAATDELTTEGLDYLTNPSPTKSVNVGQTLLKTGLAATEGAGTALLPDQDIVTSGIENAGFNQVNNAIITWVNNQTTQNSGNVQAANPSMPSHTITSVSSGSLIAGATTAITTGNLFNFIQSTIPILPTTTSGTTTTTTTTSQSSSSGAPTKTTTTVQATANNGNQTTHAVQQIANTANTAVQHAVQTISNFIGSLFGGGHH